jgi:uncharacterized protein (TIGR02246 family)
MPDEATSRDLATGARRNLSDDQQEVHQALEQLDQAFDRRELDVVLNLCSEDIVFIGSGNGEEAVGHVELAAMLEAVEPTSADHTFRVLWDAIDVEVLDDVAILTASGSAELTTPQEAHKARYRLTGLLVRSRDRWLWRVYHGSEPSLT